MSNKNYNIILNTHSDNIFSKIINTSDKILLHDVISTKYNNNNVEEMKDIDIHHDFINYIIKIAQWHKTIDPPIENKTVLKDIRHLIDNNIKENLTSKIKQLYNNNIDQITSNKKYDYIINHKYHDRYTLTDELIDTSIVNSISDNIFTNKLKYIINETDYIDKTKLHNVKSSLNDILKKYNNNIIDRYTLYKSKNQLINTTVNNNLWLESIKNSFTDTILMSLKNSISNKYIIHDKVKSLRDNWNTIRSKDKKYYSEIINFIDSDTDYRINMKKIRQNGGNITVFEDRLPQIVSLNRLWYINENNNKQVISFKDKNIIKSIYNQIYNSTNDNIKLKIDNNYITIGNTDYNTDIDLDKLIKNRLNNRMMDSLNIKIKKINPSIDINDIIKVNNDTKIYDCILDNDETKLKDCFSKVTSDYKDYFINDIKTLNPYSILRILQKFNFNIETVYDKTLNKNINKVHNVKKWLETNFKLENKTDTDRLLLLYLNTMVQYINNDTDILNDVIRHKKEFKLSNIDLLDNHRINSYKNISNNNGLIEVSDADTILANILKGEINKLKTKNRYITTDGILYSTNLLYNFHNKEKQLNNISSLISDYKHLINVFGNNYTKTIKTKYLHDLMKKYDKSLIEYKEKEDDIMNLIKLVSKY